MYLCVLIEKALSVFGEFIGGFPLGTIKPRVVIKRHFIYWTYGIDLSFNQITFSNIHQKLKYLKEILYSIEKKHCMLN